MSFFVRFLGWFENSENLYIAMEYFEKGDLRRHIGERMYVACGKTAVQPAFRGFKFHAQEWDCSSGYKARGTYSFTQPIIEAEG